MITLIVGGVVIGFIMALTGAGGGVLAVPFLLFATTSDLANVAPVGLLAVGASATFGASLGLHTGVVRRRAALLMATAGVLFAPVGVWLASRIDNHILNILFSGVLCIVAYRSFLQTTQFGVENPSMFSRSTLPCNLNFNKTRFVWTTRCARALISFGGLAGLLSGLLGVGGGFVIVPALQRFTDLQTRAVVATSLAVIALVSTSGVVTATLGGAINWEIALPFAAGSLIGMGSGRVLSNRLNTTLIQRSFATIAFLVALGILFRTF